MLVKPDGICFWPNMHLCVCRARVCEHFSMILFEDKHPNYLLVSTDPLSYKNIPNIEYAFLLLLSIYAAIFIGSKKCNFRTTKKMIFFLIFALKHRLWAYNRTVLIICPLYILLRNTLEDSGDSMISYTIIRHSRKFLNLLDPSTNFFWESKAISGS